MTLPTRSATAKRREDAAAAGRDLLQRSVGRPSLSDSGKAGTTSPRRQVRLPEDISDSVDALAAREGRKASEIMREAITEYVHAHSA